MSARTTLVAVAAALALGAAGCGDSGTTTTTASATDDPSVAQAGGGDGALALGRAAVVPFVDYGTPNQNKKTKVGVRVHEVRKGRIADFKGFNLEPAQRRATRTTSTRRSRTAAASRCRATCCGRRWRTATAASTARPRSSCSAAASAAAPSQHRSVLKPGQSFDGCSVDAAARRTPGPAACASRATWRRTRCYWEAGA